jgi:hypothetical protein
MLSMLLSATIAAIPSPILHLSADSVVRDAKGAVKLWPDLSPRKAKFETRRRAGVVDSASRPLVAPAGINGLQALHFKLGSLLVDSTSLPLDSGFTAFIVAQDSSPNNWTTLIGKGEGDLTVSLWGSDAGNFSLSQGWDVNGMVAKTQFQTAEPTLYGVTWNRTTGRLFVSGRMEGEGTNLDPVVRRGETYLGANYGSGTWQGYLRGHIGEVLIYPGELSDSDRVALEDSLLAKWKLARLGTWMRDPVASSTAPILHLRADSVIVDSRGGVSHWPDLSPRGAKFQTRKTGSVEDTASRPILAPEGIHGRPALWFRGRSLLVDSSSFPLDSGFTAFIVAQDSIPSNWTTLIGKGENDYTVSLWGSDAGNFNLGQGWDANGMIVKSSFESSQPLLYGITFDGSTGRLFVSGRLEGEGTNNDPIVRRKETFLGANFGTGKWQGYLRGHIGEVLIYPGELSDARRIRIEDSLLTSWELARLGTWTNPNTGISPTRSGQRPEVLRQVADGWHITSESASRAEMRSLDGRFLASANFVRGEARLRKTDGMSVLVLVDRDGTSRSRLLPHPR